MFACKVLRNTTFRYPLVKNVNSAGAFTQLKRTAWTAVELDRDPKELRAKWPKPSFDVSKMRDLIDHDNLEMRQDMRKFLSDPIMRPKYNISLEEEREVC